ncbi:MAG: tyrosine-type recombinase/integrase [Candidatus Sungbacteria bacterium]|nr:tyrosine-type recombinase/integrase [Candidatus Sungbacteria bacterium]
MPTAPRSPLKSHLTDFLQYCEVEKGLLPNTTKNYARFLRTFFDWLEHEKLGLTSPGGLTEDMVARYRLWLSRRRNLTRKAIPGLHVSTQVRYLIALRAFLAYFHEKNIPSLPTEKIKLPKERRERLVKFLSLDQLKKLLNAPDTKSIIGERDQAILETLFSTGLRVAELAALDRKTVLPGLGKNDYEISILGKGRYPRTIYFSGRALAALKAYVDGRTDDDDALFIALGPNAESHETLRLSVRAIERIVQKYALAAGISVLATPHTLRHTFATDLLTRGVDLRTVQEFLGHRNIATTQVYTHITSKRLRDIHRKYHGGTEL